MTKCLGKTLGFNLNVFIEETTEINKKYKKMELKGVEFNSLKAKVANQLTGFYIM